MRVSYFYYNTSWTEAVAALPLGTACIYTGPFTENYFRAFAKQWAGEEALVSIEQDVAVHGDVIPQFAECPNPWCAFGWQVGPGQWSHWWLGCTKFSAELQRAVPVSRLCAPHPPDVCTACSMVPCHRHLDVVLTAVGEYLGYEQPCIHGPDIRHLRAQP